MEVHIPEVQLFWIFHLKKKEKLKIKLCERITKKLFRLFTKEKKERPPPPILFYINIRKNETGIIYNWYKQI